MKKGLQCLVLLTAMLVLMALMVTLVNFLLCPDPARAESELKPTVASSFDAGVPSTIASIPGTVAPPAVGSEPLSTSVLTLATVSKLPSSKHGHGFVPVLMYHHFDPDPGKTSSTVMTPHTFKSQLLHLKRLGYETITLEQLHLFLTQGLDLPPNPLLITIDDGYLSTYTYAYPILKELNMKATVFAIVSFREQADLMYPHFDWEQAREMADSGVIDIQSHTYACHYLWMDSSGCWVSGAKRLDKEYQSQYEQRIYDDFLLAKNTLEEKLGRNVNAMAYPYGYFDANIKKIAAETGYQLAFTVQEGVTLPGDDLLVLPRINVPGHFTGADLEAKIQWLAKQEKPRNTVDEGTLVK